MKTLIKMKRPISILLGLVLLAGTNAVLARDGGQRGSAVGGRHSGHAGSGALMGARPGAVARPIAGVAPGYQGVRPVGHPGWQGVRPIASVHPRPGIAVRSHHRPHRNRVFIGGTVILGAPFFYPPPVYVAPAPVYVEPPAYVEQDSELIYYYCADSRAYYPSVATCPSPWVEVLPDGTIKPN